MSMSEYDQDVKDESTDHAEQTAGGEKTDDANGPAIYPPPSDPMAVAAALIDARGFRSPDRTLLLRWWRGSFYAWSGTHWTEVADHAVRAVCYRTLVSALYVNKKGNLEPWEPTRRKIGDLAEALQSIVLFSERTEPPAWLDGSDQDELIAMNNGLLHLDSRSLQPHSPSYFNLYSLAYGYSPEAPTPERWLAFLKSLWPDDAESIRLLRQWFGYVISGDTRLHKILLAVGPLRSGKGTVARILTSLLGKQNVAGPTLASMSTNFGLQPLVGKPLAVVSDARLRPDSTSIVVERLLSISGEDVLSVDRKYRDHWTGTLPTRLMLLSNELPNLHDASGAVASRFLVLTLQRSWLGHEDFGLTDALLDELPGILLWALDGLADLHEQGRFTEPQSSRDAITELADLASPVSAFVRECCVRGPGYEVTCRNLYGRWRAWCIDHGRDHPTSEAVFGRDLRAVIPGLKRIRHRQRDGSQVWYYQGIGTS